MRKLSRRRGNCDESDEDDYPGTHAPRDSTELDLSRPVAEMERAFGMHRDNLRAGNDDRDRFEDDDPDEEDHPSEDGDQDEAGWPPEGNRAYEEDDLDEEDHQHGEVYPLGNNNPYYQRQQPLGEGYPHAEAVAPEESHPPENYDVDARNGLNLGEQLADMTRTMLGRLGQLQAGQDRLEQRVVDLPRQIGAQGQSRAFNDNAADATGRANLWEQIRSLARQIKVPEQINTEEQNSEVDHNNQVEQIDLPEEVRDRLEQEDEQAGALEQPNRLSNRESIVAQVRAIAALDRSARNWLLANLWWEDQGDVRGADMTFTVGLRDSDPGWLGYWAFRSHGEGSSEELAMTQLAGNTHWPTNNAAFSADQIHEFRTRLRLSGRADITADIDLVWVPTLRLQHQGGTTVSQVKSKDRVKEPEAAHARKKSKTEQVNDGRRGTGVQNSANRPDADKKSIGVDKPIEDNEANLIGDWNDGRMTRAQRKASEQIANGLAPQQPKYTAASTGTIHPSSRPRPAKSVPRKKPTQGPGKHRPKLPALLEAENFRRQQQLLRGMYFLKFELL